LNSCKSLLFHGGDTGSIPVRDAKHHQQFTFATAPIALLSGNVLVTKLPENSNAWRSWR